MCRNGQYTERGIKQIHGFRSERWRIEPEYAIKPDAVIECTGVGQVIADSIQAIGSGGAVCLTGVGHGGIVTAEATADIAASAVLDNNVIVGSVHANKRHWYRAGEVLVQADRSWLSCLITRREKPENFKQALERKPDNIKVVLQSSEA